MDCKSCIIHRLYDVLTSHASSVYAGCDVIIAAVFSTFAGLNGSLECEGAIHGLPMSG